MSLPAYGSTLNGYAVEDKIRKESSWLSLGLTTTELLKDLAPTSVGIAALTLRGGEPL